MRAEPNDCILNRTFFQFSLLGIFFVAGAFSIANASDLKTDQEKNPPPPKSQIANGIEVGKAKVFDNRTLTLMLEALNEELRNKQFIDLKKVADALGTLQGYRLKEFSSALTVTTPTIPGVTRDLTSQLQSTVGPSATNTTDTTTDKQSTTQSAMTSSPPTLDALGTSIPATLPYGENAGDLLDDQVNLTYQIFNLRMLLDKSLSDRLLVNGSPRLQTVLGFDITISPPRIANNAVAVVEVTLASLSDQPDGVSVVALMPQERSYNATALSTKANAYGASVLAKVVQVGYAQKSKSQTFFLYQDNDTVAFERPPDDSTKSTTFGWMFRPVLGRPSVATKHRQLFAVLALPHADSQDEERKVRVKVRTYWRRFDRSTMTSFSMEDANRRTQVFYALSLTLAKPLFFGERFIGNQGPYEIGVPTTGKYQKELGPSISDIVWMAAGSKSAVVTVSGDNFFTDTRVALGDKLLANATDGLTIKSVKTLEFSTTPEAIAGMGALIGRYGSAIPLLIKATPGQSPKGVAIQNTKLGPALSGSRQLDLWLRSRMEIPDLSVSDLPSRQFVLTVNNTAVQQLGIYDEFDQPKKVVVQAMVPESLLKNGGADIKINWPFRGDLWTASTRIYDSGSVHKIARLSTKAILVSTLDPLGFRDPRGGANAGLWTLQIGAKTVPFGTASTDGYDRLSDFAAVVTQESIPEKAILTSPLGTAFVLDIPKAEGDDKKIEPKQLSLDQNDSRWIDLDVADAAKVSKIVAEEQSLELYPSDPSVRESGKKTIKAHFTRKITSNPGRMDVQIFYTGTNVPSFMTVTIAPAAKAK